MTDQSLSPFIKRIFALLGIALLLYMAQLAWLPLVWIAIAAFLAVAINPIVQWLKGYMPKQNIGLAAFIILVVFCGISIGLAWALFAPLVQQANNLLTNLPELATKLEQALAATPFGSSLTSGGKQVVGSAGQVGGVVLSVVSTAVEMVIAFVTIIALMFFMTIEGKSIKQVTLKLTPLKMRKDVTELGSKVYTIINGYVIGNFLLSSMYGVASGLVLLLMGNPYYLVLGLLAALLDLIPLVGSTIAAVLIALVCVLSGQAWAAAIFIVFTIVYVQLENAVLNPLVYSKKVDISPLTVLIAVLIGASIAGVLGTLLAIPVAATIKETSKVLLKHRHLEA